MAIDYDQARAQGFAAGLKEGEARARQLMVAVEALLRAVDEDRRAGERAQTAASRLRYQVARFQRRSAR